jgi:lipoprotein signal peptidase
MLPGNRYIFVGVSLVVLVGIVAYLWRWKPTRAWTVSALGLVAGGAIGNLIDRVVRGYVTDFVQIPFDFPVFNVADSAIVIGVAMLVWWLVFGPTPDQTAPTTAGPDGDGATPPPDPGPDVVSPGDRPAREA